MFAVIQQAPRGSAIARSVDHDRSEWGLTEQLLATAVDILQVEWWSKTEDGKRNRDRPKPVQRPGLPEPDVRTFGKGPLPIGELDDFLGWSRELAGVDPPAVEPNPGPLRDARGRFKKRD